jgi:holo-[acyl-carrier protein] synthase
MIYGIGTDICDVRRIRESLERHGERFAAKVLSEQEFTIWKARSARWPERGVRYLATRLPRNPSARPLVWACACP